jgi:hypothetical protein
MSWKEEVVRDLFRPHDVEQILGIKLPSKLSEDFVSWFYEKSGVFSMRSSYKLAKELKVEEGAGKQSCSTNQNGSPVWKDFWKIPLPHKVMIFGWRAINNGLAAQANKRQRRISTTSTCEICGMEEETVMHALIRCGHATTLGQAMRQCHTRFSEENRMHLLRVPESQIHTYDRQMSVIS